MASEKADCIFCKIARGEIPCYKVYEDENFLGFLDIRPLNPGHVLLIPKEHYRWVDDVPLTAEYFSVAQKISKALKSEMDAFAVSYVTLGFEIPHAHLHLIPRFKGDGHGGFIDRKNFKQIPEDEMKRIAEKLSKAVSE